MMELCTLSCTSWYTDKRASVAANVFAVVSVHSKVTFVFTNLLNNSARLTMPCEDLTELS